MCQKFDNANSFNLHNDSDVPMITYTIVCAYIMSWHCAKYLTLITINLHSNTMKKIPLSFPVYKGGTTTLASYIISPWSYSE